MPFKIVRNDIAKMNVDAIVNAANPALQAGGGVCGAIFDAAGYDALQDECNRIGGCAVGDAVITKGYRLSARYIIHTVGPIWEGGGHNEEKLLRSCYTNSLELVVKYHLESVAFPLISSGIYGYPKDQALRVAVSAIQDFIFTHEISVFLVVFDKVSNLLSEKMFRKIEKYIDDHYVQEAMKSDVRRGIQSVRYSEEPFLYEAPAFFPVKPKRKLSEVVNQLEETFSQMLLRLIDEKDMTDVEAYKKANIDRRLFSKIRSNPNYNPGKPTALAFAIALELSLDRTLDLLGKAGYTLSHSNKFDVIIEYFIQEGNYDIFEINEALFAFDQPLLGA